MSRTQIVLSLIQKLADITNQSLDHYGFGKMSELIPEDEISQRYLDDLHRNIKRKIEYNILFCRPSCHYLDIISQYVGYENFAQFSIAFERNIPFILKSCVGNWWSYVRDSSGQFLFVAPVKIFLKKSTQQVFMEMKGGENTFSGDLEFKGGCMFGYLKSGSDKRIGLVFKLGIIEKIHLLKGVFSGISSSGIPIAGRELLIREDSLPYENMVWSKTSITESNYDKRVHNYFMNINENCIKISDTNFFDLNDLNF